MAQDINDMIALYPESAYGVIQVKGKDNENSVGKTKDKSWNFVHSANPGLFQNGRDVVEMKRVEESISIY